MFPRDKALSAALVMAGLLLFTIVFGNGVFNFAKDYGHRLGEIRRTQAEAKDKLREFATRPPKAISPGDESNWKTYRNQKYGFEIKYPKEWGIPKEEKPADAKLAYEHKIQFVGGDKADGFSVFVYNSSKKSETAPEENPYPNLRKLTTSELASGTIKNSSTGENCSATEVVNIRKSYYLERVYFKNLNKGKFTYSLVANNISPENYYIFSTFKFKEAVAAKPRTNTPRRISGRMPADYKIIGGRLVCSKSNDKPGKSKKNNKGKIHMDMECCLDPDEIPNPNCYYSAAKYGKILSRGPHL